MATSPKSVRHLLKDKPTLKHLDSGIGARRALLTAVREKLPGDLAPHCLAAQIEGSQMLLHTDSPVWATRLRYLSARLRSLLEPDHPGLREIRIRILIGREPGQPPRRPPCKSAQAAAIIHDSAISMDPGALRDALLRLSRTLAP